MSFSRRGFSLDLDFSDNFVMMNFFSFIYVVVGVFL